MSRRIQQVNELLRRELSTIITREVEFFGTLITITIIETSSDLHYADVYFVVIPESASDDAIKKLNYSIFSIQQTLNKRLRMRPVPRIQFHIDREEQEAAEIDKILEGL